MGTRDRRGRSDSQSHAGKHVTRVQSGCGGRGRGPHPNTASGSLSTTDSLLGAVCSELAAGAHRPSAPAVPRPADPSTWLWSPSSPCRVHTLTSRTSEGSRARVWGQLSSITLVMGIPGGSDSKESAYNAGDPGSIPGLERSPGEGHGNPLQYSCLENPMDRGTCWATVHGVTESDTTERLTLSLPRDRTITASFLC